MKIKLIMLMCVYLFFTNLLCEDIESIIESGNKKKQISGYIHMLSPVRFGNDLKLGDRVVYCYKTETTNNHIRTMLKRAYGYKYFAYFRLKVLQPCGYLNFSSTHST